MSYQHGIVHIPMCVQVSVTFAKYFAQQILLCVIWFTTNLFIYLFIDHTHNGPKILYILVYRK